MTTKTILAGAMLLAFAGPAAASEIFRCTPAGGSVTYQQAPCGDAVTGGAVDIPTNFPDHTAERERLFQREAALDARLLKRLEIDAAERIARDNRIAREHELQAARERAEQAAPGFVIVPWRAQRHAPRGARPAAIR
jgi:hypothetical protein